MAAYSAATVSRAAVYKSPFARSAWGKACAGAVSFECAATGPCSRAALVPSGALSFVVRAGGGGEERLAAVLWLRHGHRQTTLPALVRITQNKCKSPDTKQTKQSLAMRGSPVVLADVSSRRGAARRGLDRRWPRRPRIDSLPVRRWTARHRPGRPTGPTGPDLAFLTVLLASPAKGVARRRGRRKHSGALIVSRYGALHLAHFAGFARENACTPQARRLSAGAPPRAPRANGAVHSGRHPDAAAPLSATCRHRVLWAAVPVYASPLALARVPPKSHPHPPPLALIRTTLRALVLPCPPLAPESRAPGVE